MPLEQRNRTRKSPGLSLDLPPPFRLVLLREVGDAVAHACAHAAELGAGTLVFVGRFDLAEFAVILEPEEPLVAARRAFYAGMVALGDALAAAAPPEKPIVIEWPDAIQVDGGLVGGGQLAWPEDADEQAVPEWLVFGAAIRTVSMSETEVGLYPLATTLEEEGFLDAGSEHLAGAFARHLMIALDRWQESGFTAIAMDYASKLKPESGLRREIDENGDLRVLRGHKLVERQRLLPALKAPSWLDPTTGGPRL
jgi:biotin-(acetyl-CoA carboxylase) ligase